MSEKNFQKNTPPVKEAGRRFSIGWLARKLGRLAATESKTVAPSGGQLFIDELSLQRENFEARPAARKNAVFKVSTSLEPDPGTDEVIKTVYKHFGINLESLERARTYTRAGSFQVNPANLSFTDLQVRSCMYELEQKEGMLVVPSNTNPGNFSLLLAIPSADGSEEEVRSFLALSGLHQIHQTDPITLTYVEFMSKEG